MKIKKYVLLVFLFIMGLTGLVIAIFPTVSNFLQERQQEKRVEEYRNQLAAMEQEMYNRLFAQAEEYKNTGVISGGMIPKVDCCMDAIRGGVNSVHIVNGCMDHSMLLELFTDEGIGTMVVKE